jgi:hypothetical protein
MVASSRALVARLRRIVARRLAQCPRGASPAPTGRLGRQLTVTMVEHHSLAPFAPWAGREWRGSIGGKGGEGPALRITIRSLLAQIG